MYQSDLLRVHLEELPSHIQKDIREDATESQRNSSFAHPLEQPFVITSQPTGQQK